MPPQQQWIVPVQEGAPKRAGAMTPGAIPQKMTSWGEKKVCEWDKTTGRTLCKRNKLVVWGVKMGISIAIDLIDLFLGVILSIFGLPVASIGPTIYDGIIVPVAYLLWGPKGLIAFWELIAVTDVGNILDGFIPTLSIIGLIDAWQNKVWEEQPGFGA